MSVTCQHMFYLFKLLTYGPVRQVICQVHCQSMSNSVSKLASQDTETFRDVAAFKVFTIEFKFHLSSPGCTMPPKKPVKQQKVVNSSPAPPELGSG